MISVYDVSYLSGMKHILVLIIPFIQIVVLAQDMKLVNVIESGLSLSEQSVQSFKQQLDQRILNMKEKIPGLYLTEFTPQSKIRDLILQVHYPAGVNYKNRQVQCAFIQRLLSQTKGSAQVRINALTQNGKICIAGDLPKTEWVAWTTEWIDILWNEKWFIKSSAAFSLEDLIVKSIGIENYKKPVIKIAINEVFDGYGFGYSDAAIAMFDSDPVLSYFKQRGLKFNPDSKEPFTLLGDEVKTFLVEESPYGAAATVRVTSEIYISPVWPIAELVELLVHEYGHVLHSEQNQTKQTWDPITKSLTTKVNTVWQEGVAESFTEMLLQDVFLAHPETQIFHLSKLRMFAEVKSKDSHLLGAALLSPLFFQGQNDFLILLELARANNLNEFLQKYKIDTLSEGVIRQKTVNVYFQ